MNLMNRLAVPITLAVVSLAGAEEQQIEVAASSSGRLYADYSHGDCCTLDAWSGGSSTIWTETCETMGGYCMGGKDVANWMFQVPASPEGAELVSVTFKVARQSGSSGSAVLKMKGFETGSLSMSRALQAHNYPEHSQNAYFSGALMHSFDVPISQFQGEDQQPFVAIGLYRSSTLGFFNSGAYAPSLEFVFDVETGSPCDGDINDDGEVNGSDLSLILGFWGSASGLHDLDENGIVDGADLAIVLGEWGSCPE